MMRAAVLAVLFLCCGPAVAADPPLVGHGVWNAGASEGVTSKATGDQTARLDYGFAGAGYAFMIHPLDFAAPENFIVEIPVRGEGAGNDLQIKFTDASGDNVWWVTRPGFVPTKGGVTVRVRPRHIDFAWGPTTDKTFRGAKRMEVVVVKTAKGAASGWLEIGPVTWRAEAPEPKVEAALKADIAAAVDGNAATGKAAKAVTIDLSRVRPFGGLKLDWAQVPTRYDIAVSDDGKAFRALRTVAGSDGGVDYVPLGEVDARYVKIIGAGRLNDAALLPLEMGVTPNALLTELAKVAPRGDYPRGFSEQSYWTVVGVAHGGSRAALLSEDGAVELGPERPSLAPVLTIDGQRYTWAQARVTPVADSERLPLPSVEWQAGPIRMTIAPLSYGDSKSPSGLVRYDLSATADKTVRLELHIQPIQVNPPAQFLTRPGGFAPIHNVVHDGQTLRIDDQPLWLLTPPSQVTTFGFLTGPQGARVSDADGMASAVIGYEVALNAGETRSIVLAFPLGDAAPPPQVSDAVAWADQQAKVARADWQQRLGQTHISLPNGAPPIADSLKLALGYQLMLMDGDWLKPGARSYDRSWIRDGAMMSEGLLRMGLTQEAMHFFQAYAPMSFDSGKVPCCVDARGADPTPENDSHGELAWLAGELIRYGVPPSEIAPYWPQISGAIAYQDGLRQQNLTPETEPRFKGLLPPSISHEGYSDKAAYAYWDDFWALKGYRGAALTARALGRNDDAKTIERQGEAFARDLKASIAATAAHYGQDVVAGAADRGDFDPTSTTMGLTAGAYEADIPAALKRQTFERYWSKILMPRRETPNVYTPYELRNVGAFLRLKQPERARQALDMFFADQSPKDWFQWAEVITVPYRQPLFIGDLPHGWVESDYLRVALDLFAYERPEAQQMVLLSGFDPKWADGEGAKLDALQTPYGPVAMTARRIGSAIEVTLTAKTAPPGGFALDLTPFGPVSVRVDGKAVKPDTRNEVLIRAPRAVVSLETAR